MHYTLKDSLRFENQQQSIISSAVDLPLRALIDKLNEYEVQLIKTALSSYSLREMEKTCED